MLILTLESSTSSAKAMLFNTQTNESKIVIKPYNKMYGDITLHNAETVFMNLVEVGKSIAQHQNIDIISLGGTWHSLMLCDKNKIQKTPVYLWSNTKASDLCSKLRKDDLYVRQYYQKTGCMVNAIYPSFKLMKLAAEGYNLKDYLIMGQGTYNVYRLTNKYVATQCLVSGTGLMDIANKTYCKSVLEEIGISENQLPEIVDYKQIFPLSKQAASLLGVKAGIPVIPTNADGALNQIGVGALKKGVMTFSVGTSGAIRFSSDNLVIPSEPTTWCYCSPKSWLSGAATSGCCNCLDWFIANVCRNELSYTDLEDEEQVDIDSPIFLPFIYGERCPGWNDDRRGGFIGINQYTDFKKLYRAIQEGVLFNLYQCYNYLKEVNGEPEVIKLSGGILKSKKWTQMCADIFQKEMTVDQQEQASLMGGNVLAMEHLGVIRDVTDYSPKQKQVIRPNNQLKDIYQIKYKKYLDAYDRLKNS